MMKKISKYKRHRTDEELINKYLEEGKAQWRLAKQSLRLSERLGFQTAYEAMIKVSLGYMLSFGVRPRSLPGHHVAIIEFVEKKLGPRYRRIFNLFDQMRKKRNRAIYEVGLIFSRHEARQAIKTAEDLIKIIEQKIEKQRKQRRLF